MWNPIKTNTRQFTSSSRSYCFITNLLLLTWRDRTWVILTFEGWKQTHLNQYEFLENAMLPCLWLHVSTVCSAVYTQLITELMFSRLKHTTAVSIRIQTPTLTALIINLHHQGWSLTLTRSQCAAELLRRRGGKPPHHRDGDGAGHHPA